MYYYALVANLPRFWTYPEEVGKGMIRGNKNV